MGQAIAFVPVVFDVPVPHQVFVVATSVFGIFLPALVATWIADGPRHPRPARWAPHRR